MKMQESPYPPNFNPVLAQEISFLSLAAMCDSDTVLERWAKENGFDEARRFKCDHNRSLVLREGGDVIVLFAGTEPRNMEQWLNYNLAAELIPHPLGGEVHGGFYRALHSKNDGEKKDLFAKTLDCLADIKARTPITHLYFGGHSLGGAMAVMAQADIKVRADHHEACAITPEEITATYTLGTPRTATPAFTETFNRIYGDRFNNGVFMHDPVPRLPLKDGRALGRLAILGMSAPGTPHYLDGEGGISFGEPPLLRTPRSLHHLPQYYERAYGELCGIENPFRTAPFIERMKKAQADYAEMVDAKFTLLRSRPGRER